MRYRQEKGIPILKYKPEVILKQRMDGRPKYVAEIPPVINHHVGIVVHNSIYIYIYVNCFCQNSFNSWARDFEVK